MDHPPPSGSMKNGQTNDCRIDSIFLAPTHTTSGSTTVCSSVCVTHDRNANVKVCVNIRRVNGPRVLWATLITGWLCCFLILFSGYCTKIGIFYQDKDNRDLGPYPWHLWWPAASSCLRREYFRLYWRWSLHVRVSSSHFISSPDWIVEKKMLVAASGIGPKCTTYL